MIRPTEGAVRRQFGILFEAGSLGGWGDGALLERFLAGRDATAEAAFAALVERHGPMVLRVCRSRLGDEHAAHDAFQAVFLVLARKARTVRIRDTVGPWLHGVAWRVASRARAAGMRRRHHERRAAEMAPRAFEDSEPRGDAEALLQEEIRRLPSGFREAVILCDLEGLTTDQAAERLGAPVGTVRSRLYRGRDRLRGRLIRRGLAPAAIGAAVASGTGLASIPIVKVPSALMESTIGLAVGCAWGGMVPARLAWLVHGGHRVMGFKGIATMGVSLGLIAGVGGFAAQGTGDGAGANRHDTTAKTKVAVPAPVPEDPNWEKADLDRLQGRWIIHRATLEGIEDTIGPRAIIFRGDQITFDWKKSRDQHSFKLFHSEDGTRLIKVDRSSYSPFFWAYELDGDHLRMANDHAEQTRIPSGIGSPGTKKNLHLWELVRDPDDVTSQVMRTTVGEAPTAATKVVERSRDEPKPTDFAAPRPLPNSGQKWETSSGKVADPAADVERLQGKWTVIKVSRDGKEITDDPKSLLSYTIGDGEIRSEDRSVTRFRIEAGSQPPAMRVAAGGLFQAGWWLYAIDGDRLRFAYLTGPHPPRATTFEGSGPDEQHPLEVLELVRDATQPTPAALPPYFSPSPEFPHANTQAPTRRSQPTPPADVRPLREQLQGTWAVLHATVNGQELEGPNVVLAPMTFRGDTVEFGPFGSPPVKNSYRFLVDPEGEPKAIRVVRDGMKPRWWLFELKGDKLRTAAWQDVKEASRPKGFEDGSPDRPLIVLELVRDGRPRGEGTAGLTPGVNAPPTFPPTEDLTPTPTPTPMPARAGHMSEPAAVPSATPPPTGGVPIPGHAPEALASLPPSTDSPTPAPTPNLPESTSAVGPAVPSPATIALIEPMGPMGVPVMSPVTPSGPRPDAGDDELNRLQGTWSVIGMEKGGEEILNPNPSTWIIAGNALIIPGPEPGRLDISTFKLGLEQRPTILLHAQGESGKAPTAKGIYRVDGPVLVFCFGPGDQPAPADFETKPGADREIVILRRKKPAARGPSMPAVDEARDDEGLADPGERGARPRSGRRPPRTPGGVVLPPNTPKDNLPPTAPPAVPPISTSFNLPIGASY